jgi:predicted solute-binding protein
LEQLTTEQDCDEATAFLLCLVEENKEVFDSFTENILRIHLELCKIEREQMREYLPKIKSSLKGSHEKQNTTIYNYIINF